MPSGGFFGYGPTAGRAAGNAGANSIFLSPLVAPQSGVATALLIDGNSGASGIQLKATIYDSSHSALLATGTTVTAVTANYNRLPLTANLNIVAGTTYWVGYVCNAICNVGVQTSGGPTSWLVSGSQSVASPANPLVGGVTNGATLLCALELDGTGSPGFGWGPDFAPGVTRSVSNTTATFGAAGNLGVRSILTHVPSDGKFYAEVDIGGTVTAVVGVGVNTVNVGATQGILSQLVYEAILQHNGTRQPGTIATGLSYAAGDTICIAYDGTNNQVWWNKNNGSWFGLSSTAGSPVGATGGFVTTNSGWPFAITAATNGTSAATFLLRDTAGALRYTPPAGFSPWSSATYPAVAGASQALAMVLA